MPHRARSDPRAPRRCFALRRRRASARRNEPKADPGAPDGDDGAARGARRGAGDAQTSQRVAQLGRRRCARASSAVERELARRASRAERRRRELTALAGKLGELRYYRRFLDEVERHRRRAAACRQIAMALFEIFDPKAPPRPIGIDLGTTNSLVAYVHERAARSRSPTATARRSCPSVVHYDAERRRRRRPARARRSRAEHPRDTIVSVKRFMGRGADDPETRRLGPYEFVRRDAGRAEHACASRSRAAASSRPVEVSAEILRALKRAGRGRAPQRRRRGHHRARRTSTTRSGRPRRTPARLAGLEVLRLLNEPTAAALAYGLEKKQNGTFAVYDLGGGTFDVTILVLDDGVFQVKSTGGDSALGGDDMDRAIAARAARGARVRRRRGRRRSSSASCSTRARKVKHALTDARRRSRSRSRPAAATQRVAITRARFDALDRAAARAHRASRAAARCKDAGLKPERARRRHPRRRLDARARACARTSRSSSARSRSRDIDPDQVVALGAAVQADLLAGRGAAATTCSCSTCSRCRSASRSAAAWSTRSCRATRPSRRRRARRTRRTTTTRPASRSTSCRASARWSADCRAPRALHAEGHPADAGRAWRGSR